MHPPGTMHTFGGMAKILNRDAIELERLRSRLGLPKCEGAGYSSAYLAFFRTVIYLRMLNISESRLADSLKLEIKLLKLMHRDSIGTATWFLEACGADTHPNRRLLLTNADIGMDLSAGGHQLGLDFATKPPELFPGSEMGEDSLRVLGECLKLHKAILADIRGEMPLLRAGLAWGNQMIRASKSLLEN